MSKTEVKNVARKIHQVMGDVTGIVKTANIQMGRGSYKAVEHDEVTKNLRASMLEHRLVALPCTIKDDVSMVNDMFRADVVVKVTFIDIDSGEYLETAMPAYALDRGDKASGKAISMATKYAYLKTFMLESFDNEEARTVKPKDLKFAVEKATTEQVDEAIGILEQNFKEGLPEAKQPTDATKAYLKGLTKVQIKAFIEKNRIM